MTDDTLKSSVVDSDVIVLFRPKLPQCTNARSSSLDSILAYAAVASSGTFHCYDPEWHNFPVIFLTKDDCEEKYFSIRINYQPICLLVDIWRHHKNTSPGYFDVKDVSRACQ